MFSAIFLHVFYMWFTCHLHVFYRQGPKVFQITYMLFTCFLHVIYMTFTDRFYQCALTCSPAENTTTDLKLATSSGDRSIIYCAHQSRGLNSCENRIGWGTRAAGTNRPIFQIQLLETKNFVGTKTCGVMLLQRQGGNAAQERHCSFDCPIILLSAGCTIILSWC